MAITVLAFCIAALVVIVRYTSDKNALLNDALGYNYSTDAAVLHRLFIAICVFASICGVLLILDLKLLYFHLWLVRNKLTTYEYIKLMREKQIKLLEERMVLPFETFC